MPIWLSIFYALLVASIVVLLFLIWRRSVERERKIEQALVNALTQDAENTRKAVDALQVLIGMLQRGMQEAHKDA